ncbi:MAG: LuxR C-terminal-related transcriptional regulator [SAR324 cluster bacterium]|nr:LuxR C-terminal-related transcriptional regulator [SAR324 cluster bacterium]
MKTTVRKNEFTLQFIEQASKCDTKADLKILIESLKDVIDFSVWSCTLVVYDQEVKSHFNINTFPKLWTVEYVLRRYYKVDPIVLKNFSPKSLGKYQFWSNTFEECKKEATDNSNKQISFIEKSKKFSELKNGITIGCQNNFNQEGLVFSIAGPNIEDTQDNQTILSSIVYYILVAIDNTQTKLRGNILTQQETKCIDQAQRGFTNIEIAKILSIKQSTVKTHMDNAYRKLDASNRANAVAIALSKKLIKHI